MRNAGNFFRAFYKPPADLKITKTILSRVLGVPPLPRVLQRFFHYPFVVINITDVAAGKFKLEEHPAHWLGGPLPAGAPGRGRRLPAARQPLFTRAGAGHLFPGALRNPEGDRGPAQADQTQREVRVRRPRSRGAPRTASGSNSTSRSPSTSCGLNPRRTATRTFQMSQSCLRRKPQRR